MASEPKYLRGSEWRQWDLHIHSPASFQWEGERLGDDEPKNAVLIDKMIHALNDATPAAFALMDYWHFDGWFALKKRRAQAGAPKLTKTVFPGIELRLAAPMPGRLNAHVLFADHINDQYLRDFLSRLKLELINQPLSRNGLIEYARKANADKLDVHGFKKKEVAADDNLAFDAGCKIAEINCDSYKTAIQEVPKGLAIGFMPFSTHDGLAQISWGKHYAYALGLFEASPIFETRKLDQWAAFVGIETDGNKKWFAPFQAALNNTPRLAVSGSDAHQFKGVPGDNDKRGYGDFPSGIKTWIKADPTWHGLLQALKEPAKRSFLGDIPPKLEKIKQNKTFYIDALSVSKVPGSPLSETWLDGCDLSLNADLIAIIGNKGSGKSALADVIALLGNSQQKAHFSFLKKDRFRGKSGEPSRQFRGRLKWLAGDAGEMLLCDDPAADKVEMVKYIPQGRFEALCNDHVSGRSNAFEQELRTVIFSHIDAPVRLDALDFDQLIEEQEDNFRARLGELRKSVHTLNEQIVSIEEQLHPDVKSNLEELIRLKAKQLEEHQSAKPFAVVPPTDALTPEQTIASARLTQIEEALLAIDVRQQQIVAARQTLGRRQRAVANVNNRLTIFEGQYKDFKQAIIPDLKVLGLVVEDVATLNVSREKIGAQTALIGTDDTKLKAESNEKAAAQAELIAEKTRLTAELNEPQRNYQRYITTIKSWDGLLNIIIGNETEPESKKGLEKRLSQINELPELLTSKKADRATLTGEIFDVLLEQRDARARLFSSLQELIQGNALIRDEYKLQFQANLQGSPEDIAANLFDMIKHNVGELRGEDEGHAAIRTRFEKYQFKSRDDATAFTNDIGALLEESASKAELGVVGIESLLRKSKSAVDVYDYIYALNYLEPKYTLLFQDTEIESLSPGQRGALLLIFYLLVDKGRNPIVLDQPEENLDNETVVSLLVPVVNEAKRTRQIIMVTHNPNLAVVCDAEQIIYASFDRKGGSKIVYQSGSIEDGIINRFVVDVLEGTKKAFNNRGQKYH